MSKLIPSCVAILAALLSTVRAVAECSSVLVVTYEGGKRLELAAKDVASITYESTGDPAYAGPGARIDNTAELLERYAPTMLIRMRSGQTHRMVLQVLHRLPNPRIDFSCIDTPGTGKSAAPPPGGAVASNPGVPSVVSPAPGSAPKPQASSSPAGRWSLDSNNNKGVLEISASGG
ncbi:MAG: hypothetical protein NTY38_32795, partial [Acidobacteria bacterium]|nr:hypothetical protein [Acidobacteriota bacterium]